MKVEGYEVEHREGTWGGIAVVAESSIPVFLMEGLYNCRKRVEDVTDAYPWLTPDAVRSALDYARDHREEIDSDAERQCQSWERLVATPREFHPVRRRHWLVALLLHLIPRRASDA